jgi:citrate synthase
MTLAGKVSDRYLTAREAAAALDVSLATLYAYVSRGMLHSEPLAGRTRAKRYLREDINRLIERKEVRSEPAKVAARGLHWGSPVLDSALTLIDDGRLFYRGIDAIKLATSASFEEVAALLWLGDTRAAARLFNQEPLRIRPIATAARRLASQLGPVEQCQLVLPIAASREPSAYDLRPEAVARTGAVILPMLFWALTGLEGPVPLEAILAQAWVPQRRSASGALRAALILCADHELNVSAFTARCIASSQATPYEVVLGALAALRGRRHGGATEAVTALFEEMDKTRDPRAGLERHLRASGYVPGFGHPAYPAGDPRGHLLIELAHEHGTGAGLKTAERLQRAAHQLIGELPNLDFGLVTLARALGLPREAPIALFALGRSAGWIAHAIEQYADSRLIRPRAHYTGPPPLLAPPGPNARPTARRRS